MIVIFTFHINAKPSATSQIFNAQLDLAMNILGLNDDISMLIEGIQLTGKRIFYSMDIYLFTVFQQKDVQSNIWDSP